MSNSYSYIYYPAPNDSDPLLKVYNYSPETGGRYGFIDRDGVEVVAPQLVKAQEFRDGLVAIANTDTLWGFMDGNGKTVIDHQFADTKPFSEGLALVKEKDRGRIINKQGEFINNTVYRYLPEIPFEFVEGLAIVKVENKYGYMNPKGELVVPYKYTQAFAHHDGRARVRVHREFGFIDTEGNEVIPCKYYQAADFSEGKAAVVQMVDRVKTFGFMKPDGTWMVEPVFKYSKAGLRDKHFNYRDDRVIMKYDTGRGIMDENGKEITSPQYHLIHPYVNRLARVKHNSKWGVIDYDGKVVIEPNYQEVLQIEGEPARIRKHQLWGLLDDGGNMVLPVEYDKITWMGGGLVLVEKTSPPQMFYVDTTGKQFLAK